jgi:malate dehydrogenase
MAKRVLITGAAGQIGYALCPTISRGAIFGPEQKVTLHLLDMPFALNALEGVKMELLDGAYPLLDDVHLFTAPEEAFVDVDVVIMCGGVPRKPGMERKDVMGNNVKIYVQQAQALDKYAKKDVKVLVVANPANTNALMLAKHAPSIPKENITALTRLDHNRALAQIAQRAQVHVASVKNVIIWGNHSGTQYPDVEHGVINGRCIKDVLSSADDVEWLQEMFIPKVQQRGAEILKARGLSSAMSAASAACDHMRDWLQGTKDGEWVSMGVYSDGSYGQPVDVIYSFPCVCDNGKWVIVQDLPVSNETTLKMKITADELIEERSLALECI